MLRCFVHQGRFRLNRGLPDNPSPRPDPDFPSGLESRHLLDNPAVPVPLGFRYCRESRENQPARSFLDFLGHLSCPCYLLHPPVRPDRDNRSDPVHRAPQDYPADLLRLPNHRDRHFPDNPVLRSNPDFRAVPDHPARHSDPAVPARQNYPARRSSPACPDCRCRLESQSGPAKVQMFHVEHSTEAPNGPAPRPAANHSAGACELRVEKSAEAGRFPAMVPPPRSLRSAGTWLQRIYMPSRRSGPSATVISGFWRWSPM
jgi:hypothetical protein